MESVKRLFVFLDLGSGTPLLYPLRLRSSFRVVPSRLLKQQKSPIAVIVMMLDGGR